MDDKIYLDCGGSFNKKTNLGNFPNDCFDDNLYNARILPVQTNERGTFVPWVLIMSMSSHDIIEDCELFIKYGKAYWCYQPNFDTLPDDQKLKCQNFYKIANEEFYGFDDDDEEEVDISKEANKKRKAPEKTTAAKPGKAGKK